MFLNLNWYGETSNCCLDVNPNSNGKLSPNAVVEQKDFIQNSFLFAKPAARDKSKKGGTVYTRNIKLYNICVNACSTNEQEQVLSDRLKEVHLEIMQLGATEHGLFSLRMLSGLFSLRMLSGLFSLWLVHIYARHTGALRAVFTSDAPSSSRTNADVDVEVEVVASS